MERLQHAKRRATVTGMWASDKEIRHLQWCGSLLRQASRVFWCFVLGLSSYQLTAADTKQFERARTLF